MATAARLPFAARRNEMRLWTIRFVGLDLSAAVMRMQVRLKPDTPGAPLIDLETVTTLAAEGLKIESVVTEDGLPVSTVRGRINLSTMSDAARLPYMGEVGDDSALAYAVQIDGTTRIVGTFTALASAMDSDGAPANRPISYGGVAGGSQWSGAQLTFGDEIISVAIDGADLIAPLVAEAEAARDAVKPLWGSGAPASGLGIDGSVYYDIADPLNPIMYGPKDDPGAGWGDPRPLRGPSNPADNVAGTLLDLKAAPTSRGTMLAEYSGGTPFTWTLGDFR